MLNFALFLWTRQFSHYTFNLVETLIGCNVFPFPTTDTLIIKMIIIISIFKFLYALQGLKSTGTYLLYVMSHTVFVVWLIGL